MILVLADRGGNTRSATAQMPKRQDKQPQK
jgi:hypothetical protein